MADLSDDPLELSLALPLGRRPTTSSPPYSTAHPEPILTLSGSPDIPQHSSRYEKLFLCGADRAAVEAAERQTRSRDREARENEPPLLGRKLEIQIPEARGFPAAVQYVPVVNGYGVPCVMPCAIGGDGSKKKKRNVYHPVANPAPGMKGVAGVPSNSGGGGSGSSSSSGISAHQSGSLPAGSKGSSGSDTRTNSSLIVEKQPQPQISSLASNPREKYARIQATESSTEKFISSTAQSTLIPTSDAAPRKLEGANSVNKPLLMVDEKESKSRDPSLPRMPCVATTGDGPNGKTITGVLYRYTKSEVSILCVCHGTSFTPAEFVKHAGGTETEHPMRKIVVVSS